MPCNSSHLKAKFVEVEYSKVKALLVELQTGELPKYFGDGYHKGIYGNVNRKDLDKLTELLCYALKKVKDIKKHSPEMQIWWRKHQEADKKKERK